MLKRKQGAKWALRNVADGIAYFKKGNMTEAFQCLNQALKFDPENVEALVARGALSANGGAFSKAVEDFELALKINPNHQNAKKYMGETLLAVGKRYEDEKNVDEALKTYHLCLEHIPGHKEAMEFIAAIKQSKSQDDLLMLTDIKVNDPEVKEKIRQLLKESTKKKTKTGKSKKKKKKYSSSSSASSSTSSEDSDDSSNTKLKRKRSNSKPEEIKEQSLSPLSKRMGMLERGHNVSGYPQCETLSGPVTSSHDFKLLAPMGQKLRSSEDLEYEEKVRKFLEQTMTKSEDKVEKKKSEKKDEKKKKKKDKKEKKKKEKLKKKDKSKKKDSKFKSDKKCDETDVKPDELGESSLHELKDLEAKLSAYYAKVESGDAVKDKKEKKVASDSKKKKKKKTSRGKNKKKKHDSSESSEDSSSSDSGSSESDASSSSSTSSSSSSEDSKPKKKKKKSKDSKSKSRKKSKASSKDNMAITTKSLDKRIPDKPIPKLVASHGLIPSQLKGKGILPCLPQQTGRTEKDLYDPFEDPNSSAIDKWKPVGKDEEEEVVEVVCSEGEGGRQESVLSKLREMQEENSIEKMKQVFEDYKRGFKIPRKNYPHMVDSSLYRNHGGFIPRDPDRSRSRSRSRSRRSHSRSRSGSRHRYSRSRSHSYSPRRRRPKYITNYRGRGYRPRGFRGRSRGFYPRNKYRRGGYRTRSPSYYGHYSRHRSRSGSRHRSSSSSRYRSRSRSYSRSPRPRTKAERVMHQVMKAKRKIARKITEAERLERLENDHRHSSDDMKDSDRSPPRDYNNKPDLVEIN